MHQEEAQMDSTADISFARQVTEHLINLRSRVTELEAKSTRLEIRILALEQRLYKIEEKAHEDHS
jgi:BMFP domain-containing protein YqiC